jgi:hypothetical protein
MARLHVIAASAVLALAAAAPVLAEGGSKGTGTSTSNQGSTHGTAPSRSTLPSSAVTTSSIASPFAWIDDGRVLEPATISVSVSTLHWQGNNVSEVDVPVTSVAAGVAPRVQAGAIVPNIIGNSDPTGAVGGLGSTYFYGKIALLGVGEESSLKLAVAPTIEVLSDAAAQSLLATESRVQFGVPVGFEFDAGTTRVFAGAGFFTRGIRFAGGGVAAQASQKLMISVSLSHSWTTTDALGVVADRTELTGTAAYMLAPHVSVFGSIGQTLATSDQDGAGTTISGGMSVLLRPLHLK